MVDRTGRVLMDSSDEIGIFGVAAAPDGERVLVKGGDARHLVLEPKTGKKISLPVRPPGEGMLGFGDWYWLGPRKLLGVSGVEFLRGQVQQLGDHQRPAHSQTGLYLFDLAGGELSEIAVPVEMHGNGWVVAEVSFDGRIHLVRRIAGDGSGDLGWFEVRVGK